MKKLLLAGTALVGFAALATPAHAELKLDLGGYFSGYGVFTDNNEAAGAATSLREFDLRRDTEVHVSGETTLDNGLTVGFHTEQALGGPTTTDEAYIYGSGGWGRVNLGSEDGAAYLLQVAAPGADSNVDGLRTYVQALNPRTPQTQFLRQTVTGVGPTVVATTTPDLATFAGGALDTVLDYDHVSDPAATNTDRISYLTPKLNGFQAGASYAPESGQNLIGNNVAGMSGDKNATGFLDASAANALSGNAPNYQDIWEVGGRWDGEFQGFGIALGGGYSNADQEGDTALVAGAGTVGDVGLNDGIDSWNAGANLTWSGFSLGGAYLRSDTKMSAVVADGTGPTYAVATGDVTRKTWTVGTAWDNGPYHLGASFLKQTTEFPTLSNQAGAAAVGDVSFSGGENDVKKTTLGGGYTFGPGMSFRGSVAFGNFDYQTGGAASNDFQQVAIGTEIDF